MSELIKSERKTVRFEYPVRGHGRPQILMVGNGLERKSGQVSWSQLVDKLTVQGCLEVSEEEKSMVPFPLLYELLSVGTPIPSVIDDKAIGEEERRLRKGMSQLSNLSNDLLDQLPGLKADHIFTTNYSYCLEKAFYKRRDFKNPSSRSCVRFNLLPHGRSESYYRLHSGYYVKNKMTGNAEFTGLWHIHGEIGNPGSIVLGHDRYGRLLMRIIDTCSNLDYEAIKDESERKAMHSFTSWPELFLFGDVYIVGLGFELSEFDLWWLLKRKQREGYGDGSVFFYDKGKTDNKPPRYSIRDKMLMAHGVHIIDCGADDSTSYDEFYGLAFDDIKAKIAASRQEGQHSI